MIVYVAGPYRGKTHDEISANIQQAREVSIHLWQMGHTALCPHLNTAHFEDECSCADSDYLDGDLQLLARCDAIVMTPDWERSAGARVERAFAEARKIPVHVYPDLPLVHPTEYNRPQQVRAFIDVVMQMYRVHLDKNADYSPANILGAGEIGLMTRVWDKISRLMNLMGFRIEISQSKFDKPMMPKNESIDDNVMDFTVYGVIWQLHRRGTWGK